MSAVLLSWRSGWLYYTAAFILTVIFVASTGYLSVVHWIDSSVNTAIIDSPSPSALGGRLQSFNANEKQHFVLQQQSLLISGPLNAEALENLAQIALLDNRQKDAEELILQAANRSLRDISIQARAIQLLLERRDFRGALHRLDGLFRSNPQHAAQFLPIVAAFTSEKDSQSALVDLLKQDPPWRAALISYLTEKATEPLAVYRLFAALRTSEEEITSSELRMLLARFLRDRDYETAFFVWLDFLSESELLKVAPIFDGGFDLRPKNLFFDWTLSHMQNVDLRLVPRSTGSLDQVLQIDFVKTRERFANLSQVLRLTPGSYVFSGETRADALVAETGLVWRFYCLVDGERELISSPRLPTVSTWTRFEMRIDIPVAECRTQQLRLEVDARSALDAQIDGRVNIDNLSLKKN